MKKNVMAMFAKRPTHQHNQSANRRASNLHAEPTADSAIGISHEPDGEFISLSNDPNTPNILNISLQPNTNKVADKWKAIAESMLKNDAWSNIRRLLDQVPKSIEEIYDKLESKIANPDEKLDQEARKVVYKEFSRMSSTSFGELQAWEIEVLVQSDVVKAALRVENINPAAFNRVLKEMIGKRAAMVTKSSADRSSAFDFEQFACIAYEILSHRRRLVGGNGPGKQLGGYFPIDPDATVKQSWDIFMMVLLVYCSFEVPYTLAFSTADDSTIPPSPFEVTQARRRRAAHRFPADSFGRASEHVADLYVLSPSLPRSRPLVQIADLYVLSRFLFRSVPPSLRPSVLGSLAPSVPPSVRPSRPHSLRPSRPPSVRPSVRPSLPPSHAYRQRRARARACVGPYPVIAAIAADADHVTIIT